jgi:protein transport protein SEC39
MFYSPSFWVTKCSCSIHAFPNTIRNTLAEKRLEHLLTVTHSVGQYRLVLKQGEPFTPVVLRVHADPISLIGKILDQNPKSYTKINDFVHMGEQMVLAGLTVRDVEGHAVIEPDQEREQISIAKKRITSMCIDSALTEDDFETAYSYVMNRLSPIASEAQARTPLLERSDSGILAHPPPRILDDWSWRAALQAGKYRPNKNTIRPTHLGNASSNLEIRHLEQRKDCLSQALRIAPPSTLHEILNVFRRCEEELDTKIKEEAEQEAAWDEQGDQTIMPGGFSVEPPKKQSRGMANASGGADEAPMSLFDLTRASAAKAQNSLSALTTLTGGSGREAKTKIRADTDQVAGEVGVERATVRKRDQLRNAAVGTLATGIGWLINAPVPAPAPE